MSWWPCRAWPVYRFILHGRFTHPCFSLLYIYFFLVCYVTFLFVFLWSFKSIGKRLWTIFKFYPRLKRDRFPLKAARLSACHSRFRFITSTTFSKTSLWMSKLHQHIVQLCPIGIIDITREFFCEWVWIPALKGNRYYLQRGVKWTFSEKIMHFHNAC